jgi:DNA invertase Pin-like site-specific DNA recombinase
VEIMAEYREVEAGKRKERPELANAVAHCRRAKATLVVAKLDRLARNVGFTSALMESKVDFVCCDNPHANKLTIHILAAVAEHEAEAISERTKAALAAAKARGVKLGSARPGHWDGREDRRLAGVKAPAKAAGEAHARAADEVHHR